ncbi:ring-cleaving dioxygenase [Niabella drilacis]|uniref:Glyoxalase family protein n=1 Tax=Niabella drilacis (strain DSM 25811 / CCM 8410 / CCUG 62505 / LMG 26954 / E90) TaxID=1285928 RepID=A0A1G6QEB8_NIADE|nr:ring-cleaving dioxygenase [Niabella drilacis]SDC90653.1 glyoxalase family protein [Niabella drilacis]
MENKVLGLHHITAIADNAKRNHAFYTNILGLRLVKKTVNFDDPGTYHFYYGNESGTPGTILTFFPWEGIGKGRAGAGMTTHIGYTVPEGSFDFWKKRFDENKITYKEAAIFGEQQLAFTDPDGLQLSLIIPAVADGRVPWTTSEVAADVATKGFHNATLTLHQADPTAKVLTDLLGYRQTAQEGNRYRFVNENIDTANYIDIIEDPGAGYGRNAAGTNHHIAFRVADDTVQMELREKIAAAGLNITPKIDRDYFYSLYFREPGGVLFEIATDNPGFTRDEPLEQLGTALKLPRQYEPARNKIEAVLPQL